MIKLVLYDHIFLI